jgi:hypothetical protein
VAQGSRSWRARLLLWTWSPFVLLPILLILVYLYVLEEDVQPPLVDVMIHYNEEVWPYYPPRTVARITENLAVTHMVVTSVTNEGTQRLLRQAPLRVIPLLSVYRVPDDRNSWYQDPQAGVFLEQQLELAAWRGIGEIHLIGAQVDAPVARRVAEIAGERDLVLLVHADSEAIERLFALKPTLRIVWAHAGTVTTPVEVETMLARYPNLWAELSHRNVAPGGGLDPGWRELFLRYPDRFMVGSGTYMNEHWYRYRYKLGSIRHWLGQLPEDVALRIAHENALRLFLGH